MLVDAHFASDNLGITAKAGLPAGIAQNRDFTGVIGLLV
jgi:hypothetical protein